MFSCANKDEAGMAAASVFKKRPYAATWHVKGAENQSRLLPA